VVTACWPTLAGPEAQATLIRKITVPLASAPLASVTVWATVVVPCGRSTAQCEEQDQKFLMDFVGARKMDYREAGIALGFWIFTLEDLASRAGGRPS
jgi:hypothetical protein